MSAKINDMYYAYSAIEDIKEKGEYGGVVTTIMKYLLEDYSKIFNIHEKLKHIMEVLI